MDISKIIPTQKDLDRVKEFKFDTSFGRCSFYGNGSPHSSGAKKMAKLIKDPKKLIRRAKAVVQIYGTRDYTGYSNGGQTQTIENVYKPFKEAMIAMGISRDDIYKIENS